MNEQRAPQNDATSSRREFLKSTSLAGAAFAAGVAHVQGKSENKNKPEAATGKLKIKVAGYKYDHVEALFDERSARVMTSLP